MFQRPGELHLDAAAHPSEVGPSEGPAQPEPVDEAVPGLMLYQEPSAI
jgi:hypothetical protein